MKRFLTAAALVCMLVSCGGRKGTSDEQAQRYRAFPETPVPSIYTEPSDRLGFALDHYWDEYFKGAGVTDSVAILGVKKDELENHLATYIGVLENAPMDKAQKSVEALFKAVEKRQEAEQDSSLFFLRFTETVARYLYDPNSPMRSEDFFLPFVRGLAASPFTRDDMRPGYAYQAGMCAINQFGEQVPDFQYKDISGRTHNLFGIKAAYTMLFFSNPGCEACKEIVDQITGRPYMESLIAGGMLAVVNIYIDQEIDAWKEYEPNYPRSWHTGYDHLYRIREEQIYDVRAIPSLYLLDGEKRVIMKDAPTEKVLAFLDNIVYGQN